MWEGEGEGVGVGVGVVSLDKRHGQCFQAGQRAHLERRKETNWCAWM